MNSEFFFYILYCQYIATIDFSDTMRFNHDDYSRVSQNSNTKSMYQKINKKNLKETIDYTIDSSEARGLADNKSLLSFFLLPTTLVLLKGFQENDVADIRKNKKMFFEEMKKNEPENLLQAKEFLSPVVTTLVKIAKNTKLVENNIEVKYDELNFCIPNSFNIERSKLFFTYNENTVDIAPLLKKIKEIFCSDSEEEMSMLQYVQLLLPLVPISLIPLIFSHISIGEKAVLKEVALDYEILKKTQTNYLNFPHASFLLQNMKKIPPIKLSENNKKSVYLHFADSESKFLKEGIIFELENRTDNNSRGTTFLRAMIRYDNKEQAFIKIVALPYIDSLRLTGEENYGDLDDIYLPYYDILGDIALFIKENEKMQDSIEFMQENSRYPDNFFENILDSYNIKFHSKASVLRKISRQLYFIKSNLNVINFLKLLSSYQALSISCAQGNELSFRFENQDFYMNYMFSKIKENSSKINLNLNFKCDISKMKSCILTLKKSYKLLTDFSEKLALDREKNREIYERSGTKENTKKEIESKSQEMELCNLFFDSVKKIIEVEKDFIKDVQVNENTVDNGAKMFFLLKNIADRVVQGMISFTINNKKKDLLKKQNRDQEKNSLISLITGDQTMINPIYYKGSYWNEIYRGIYNMPGVKKIMRSLLLHVEILNNLRVIAGRTTSKLYFESVDMQNPGNDEIEYNPFERDPQEDFALCYEKPLIFDENTKKTKASIIININSKNILVSFFTQSLIKKMKKDNSNYLFLTSLFFEQGEDNQVLAKKCFFDTNYWDRLDIKSDLSVQVEIANIFQPYLNIVQEEDFWSAKKSNFHFQSYRNIYCSECKNSETKFCNSVNISELIIWTLMDEKKQQSLDKYINIFERKRHNYLNILEAPVQYICNTSKGKKIVAVPKIIDITKLLLEVLSNVYPNKNNNRYSAVSNEKNNTSKKQLQTLLAGTIASLL